MYEIWLGLNILYELALTVWPDLALLVLAWAVFMLMRRKNLMQVSLRTLWLVAALVFAVASIVLPYASQSSLSAMTYWVDWSTLLGTAAGFGVVAALLAWPVLASPKEMG